MLDRGIEWTDWICIYVQMKYKVGLSKGYAKREKGGGKFLEEKNKQNCSCFWTVLLELFLYKTGILSAYSIKCFGEAWSEKEGTIVCVIGVFLGCLFCKKICYLIRKRIGAFLVVMSVAVLFTFTSVWFMILFEKYFMLLWL